MAPYSMAWDSLANWLAAAAKKRRLATARGISKLRARRYGFAAINAFRAR